MNQNPSDQAATSRIGGVRSTGWLIMLSVIALMLSCSLAHSQIAVRLKMNKANYMLNEPITATLYITNHAGRQLVLQGDSLRPWLSFHLTASGKAVPIARRINYKPAVIPIGQTVARSINLGTTYSLGRMANYTCTATVNMPGPTRNGFTSNRERFTVMNGRKVWVQRAGVPQAPGEIREYKLLSFSGNRALELYAQVSSANSGLHIATIPLGKTVNMRRPTGTLDSKNNMHALYQVKPNLFTHTVISPNGKVLSSSHHKRGAGRDPRLYPINGAVVVAGGVPYNEQAEAAQRKKIRNISERPPFLYKH